MTRGLQFKFSAAILGIFAIFPTLSYAGSLGRAVQDDTAKVSAPTKEDSADYFATSRKGVSKEDAKKADDLRGKTIDQIKSILAKQKGVNEFELWLRLGELYVERADFQQIGRAHV